MNRNLINKANAMQNVATDLRTAVVDEAKIMDSAKVHMARALDCGINCDWSELIDITKARMKQLVEVQRLSEDTIKAVLKEVDSAIMTENFNLKSEVKELKDRLERGTQTVGQSLAAISMLADGAEKTPVDKSEHHWSHAYEHVQGLTRRMADTKKKLANLYAASVALHHSLRYYINRDRGYFNDSSMHNLHDVHKNLGDVLHETGPQSFSIECPPITADSIASKEAKEGLAQTRHPVPLDPYFAQ